MDYEHVDFPTAVRRLAQRRGIPLLEESTFQETGHRDTKKRLLDLHAQVALWYHHQLLRSQEAVSARSYLKERGFSKEIAVAWHIGYAPSSWDATKAWGLAAGFTHAELVAGGLVLERSAGKSYDRFRHRLMFPIRNDYGAVVGFSGRTLSNLASHSTEAAKNSVAAVLAPSSTLSTLSCSAPSTPPSSSASATLKTGFDEAKYLNSPETPIFTKGRILFGMDKSKRALIQAKEAIVMEGQIDLIAAFEQGCQNVVAPQGTAFTAEQAHLLRRFVERIILCFDSDSAGKNAVERSLPALLSQGFEVRIARLPQGEDPDSLIRKQGIAVFKSMIEQAEDFFEDAIVQAKVDHGGRLTPHETAALAKRLGGYLNLFPDATLREVTAAQVAAQLGISTVTLKESAQHIIFSSAQKIETLDPDPVEKISAGTELLCRLALADPEVRAWLRDQKNPSPREVDSELILLEELLALENFSSEESLAAILSQLSPRLQRLISSWDLEKKGTDPLKSAQDAWNGLKIAAWKREQTEAIAALNQPGIQPAVILTLQKKILELQELINTSNSSPKIAIDAS